MESHARQRLLYAVTVRPKSLYEDVHTSTGYRIETSPTRDKHAHGIAERSEYSLFRVRW